MNITLPLAINGAPHRCEWSMRNPRRHLTRAKLADLLHDLAYSGDQRVTCPGCGKSVYLTIQINGHNKPGMHGKRKYDLEKDDYNDTL